MPSRERGKELYDLLLELDRLEELREELDERGLRSVDEIEQRIEEISAQVEALEGNDANAN